MLGIIIALLAKLTRHAKVYKRTLAEGQYDNTSRREVVEMTDPN
jgi:hypothetical protein